MLRKVTDPAILEEYERMKRGNKVTDPQILQQFQQSQTEPKVVNTFLGPMERKPEEFVTGSPKNKALLEDLVTGFAGGPGMTMIAKGAGALAGKAGSALKETVSSATKDITPLEQAAEKAGKAHEEATIEAEAAKPGLYKNPANELQDIEHEIGRHLNIEGAHDVRAATGITQRAKAVEDFWSDAYKQFENKVKDSKFSMPEKSMENLSYDQGEVLRRLQQGADPKKVIQQMEREKQNPFYDELISNAPTSKDVNAGDFLAKYKDFRDAMSGLKQDLKSERYGSVEKKAIRNAIEKGKAMETDIKSALNEGLGEFKPEFDWLNKGYAEQVFPLRKNPIVKAAKKGKLSSNIMKDLRTNESGMPLVRDMVKEDPELLKNIVGQRYKAKPSEIHNPDEITREYLEKMPEFKDLITKKELALSKYAKRKDISLKEKMRAEKELSEMKSAKEKARKRIKVGLYTGALAGGSAIGIPSVFPKLGKTFTQD